MIPLGCPVLRHGDPELGSDCCPSIVLLPPDNENLAHPKELCRPDDLTDVHVAMEIETADLLRSRLLNVLAPEGRPECCVASSLPSATVKVGGSLS